MKEAAEDDAVKEGAPKVKGGGAEDDGVEASALPPAACDGKSEEEDDDGAGKVKEEGAGKEKTAEDGAAAEVGAAPFSSSSAASPPPPSSSHVLWSASSYDMPHTGQSPVLALAAPAEGTATFDPADAVAVDAEAEEMEAENSGALEEVEPKLKGATTKVDEDGSGAEGKENGGADAAFTGAMGDFFSSCPPRSSSQLLWSASSYAIPHTGQSPFFAAGAAFPDAEDEAGAKPKALDEADVDDTAEVEEEDSEAEVVVGKAGNLNGGRKEPTVLDEGAEDAEGTAAVKDTEVNGGEVTGGAEVAESKESGGVEEAVEGKREPLLPSSLSFSSCFSFSLSLLPPIMARVGAPDALLVQWSLLLLLSSVRRLRLNAVCVLSVEGSKVEANGALNGDDADDGAAADDDDEDVREETEPDTAEDDKETAGNAGAGLDDADDGFEGVGEEEMDEKGGEAEMNTGTAGRVRLGSATFASAASAAPRLFFTFAGSSILRVFDLESSALLFVASSSSPARALPTRGRASDLTGVMAPPAPPIGHFREGSKRPRSEGREAGLEEEDGEGAEAETEATAREETMGDGGGRVRRFCDNSGVRSSEARMRWAV